LLVDDVVDSGPVYPFTVKDKGMMMFDEKDLAALALVSRLAESTVKPLSAREFWALHRRVEPSMLHGMTAVEIASALAISGRGRRAHCPAVRPRHQRCIALEKLDHSGI
jgi:hypothetical protein